MFILSCKVTETGREEGRERKTGTERRQRDEKRKAVNLGGKWIINVNSSEQ